MARDFAQTSEQYLTQIDAEIQRLQQLRKLLTGAIQGETAVASSAKKARKGMSAEGRRRVAEAQRACWAALKKSGGKAAKKSSKSTAAAE